MAGKGKTSVAKGKADKKVESDLDTAVVKSSSSKSSSNFNRKLVLGVTVILVLFVGWSVLRKHLIVATVNGTPIYRYGLVLELEKQGGEQVLDKKIIELLILDVAMKQGVNVDENVIDDEIISIEGEVTTQGQNLDDLLALQGMDRFVLRNQIRLQKLVEQMLPETEQPSDEEIVAQLELMAETFPEEMSEEDRRNAVVDQLSQQGNAGAAEAWIQSLKDGADIQYLRRY